MNKESILHFFGAVSLIGGILLLPFILLGIAFSSDGEQNFVPVMLIYIGYGVAVVMAIRFMKYDKPRLLLFSLMGWAIMWSGSAFDEAQRQHQRESYCWQMRQDPSCTEDSQGTIECENGNISIAICQGIPR